MVKQENVVIIPQDYHHFIIMHHTLSEKKSDAQPIIQI